ncbi:MAG: DUF305 domain-containing protein, partial [Rubrobacteraceae bacterium]
MRTKYLVPILAVLAILLAGVGTAYAGDRTAPRNGQWNGQGMMSGAGSMMGGQGMYGGSRTGNFDESRPFDLQFIDRMTPHHQMAITSSEYMISDSDRPELRKLADDIQKSQSGQIDQMQEWRQQWYPDAGSAYGTYDMSTGTMEQMMGGSMQETMGGDATDAMFLRMMIPHHQQAIDMSRQALDRAERPEIKDLARKIIDEQSAEIEQMQGYLQEI